MARCLLCFHIHVGTGDYDPVGTVLQILEEAMLEDINCLLGSGEVPNLFTLEEEADIAVRVRDAVRATGKPGTRVSATGVNPA